MNKKLILAILVIIIGGEIDAQIITDRPDQTESSSTIAQGSLQIESGVFMGNEGNESFSTRQTFLPTNLFRYGLTNGIELRILNQFEGREIENDNFISISHSKKFAAIIISKNKVGLDIEQISEKPLRLSSKFISDNIHQDLTKEKATLIWCAKEAIYKWSQKGNIDFIKDIKLHNFEIAEKGILTAEFKTERLFLNYQKINNHYLVYVCK